MKYFVVENYKSEPLLSWSSKKECGEGFTDIAKAMKRAKELASSNPGVPHGVVRLEHVVVCDVSEPKISKST